VPKEWDVDVWVNVCHKVSVGIATSTTKHFTDLGVPLIRNQNIKENNIDISDLLHISNDFAEMNKSKALEKGDILTIRTGYPGLSAVTTEKHSGWQTFTTLISRNQIVALQGGGAQQNLNVSWLNKIKVIVLTPEEQDAVATRINSIYRQIDKEQEYLAKLLKFKLGLMQTLLTGSRRVKLAETVSS
jgi:type I restriction enzyme S subunit